jgi:hypothetical protein
MLNNVGIIALLCSGLFCGCPSQKNQPASGFGDDPNISAKGSYQEAWLATIRAYVLKNATQLNLDEQKIVSSSKPEVGRYLLGSHWSEYYYWWHFVSGRTLKVTFFGRPDEPIDENKIFISLIDP